VVVLERTNARFLQSLEEPVDMVVVDASFISLKILLPTIVHWLKPDADLVTLIKPQFEAGRDEVGKGGVVKNRDTHIHVVRKILDFALQQQFAIRGLTTSPLKGPAGNIEFLAWLARGNESDSLEIDDLIASVFG
jgi:23S rRNA (cytidine1920-2'-O)/16S rRNA (cytidine1409-2'-O)-methyltransferase